VSLCFSTAGTRKNVISIEEPQVLIDWYNGDKLNEPGVPNVMHGPDYYASKRITGDPDELGFDDLPWAVLLDGQPRGDGALHLLKMQPVDISAISNKPLHLLNPADRRVIAEALEAVCGRGVGCPIASKMLHPKRRESVPVLDNSAIFGSFDHANWEPWGRAKGGGTVKRRDRILQALNRVHVAVSDPANKVGWLSLEKANPPFTRIELFDQVWWACRYGGDVLRAAAGVTER
jgi:hypothetical protein